MAVISEEYPDYSETAELGNKGRRIVERQIHDDLGWIFREIAKDDLGIDGLVEIVGDDRKSRGRTFAVQIKCGTSYFNEECLEGYVYRGSLKHLNYWLSHSLKVVLILCHPVTQVCYWTPIEPHTVQRYRKSWSIAVPKKNTLTQDQLCSLETVTQSPQGYDVIPLALYRLICEKFPGIQIHNILQTPHDFLYFDEMASYKGELLLIKQIYKPTYKFEVSDVEDVIEGFRRCRVACGWGDREEGIRVVVFFIAHTTAELVFSEPLKKRLDELDDIAYYRVKCSLEYGVSLNEVDENGGLILLYDLKTGDPETFGWKA